jgi:amino acid transporter
LEDKNDGLKRELGILDVATNVVNIAIGSGIFLLPALIAGILGNASIVAYVICGIIVLLVALCYAEMGSRITTSGGSYIYIEKAFGPYFGFLAFGFLLFGTGILVSAALINGLADMLSTSFPVFEKPIFRGLLFFILFSFYAFVNIIGVKQGMKVIKLVTFVKILPLVALVIIGVFNVQFANLQWHGFPALENIGAASLVLFFAFIGGETALNVSGEMKNPARTAPLGLLLGIISVVVFYSLIQLVTQGLLGEELIGQKAPLAAAAGKLFGTWGTQLLVLCGVVAVFSGLNSIVLVYSRVMFAASNNGLLPSVLAKVHTKFATPHLTIISFSLVAFVMALSGGFKQLMILATMSGLFLYVGVALAAIKFRIEKVEKHPASFKLPGGILIPILTLIALSWFILQSNKEKIIGFGIFIIVLSLIFYLKKFISAPSR